MKTAALSKSLMKMRNRMGPRTLPCGTPDSTSVHEEYLPFSTTLCFRPVSQLLIQASVFCLMPCALSFSRSLSLGTLSKALAKSRKTTSNGLPESITSIAFSRNSSRFVQHDLP
jgi:hypothetical protein